MKNTRDGYTLAELLIAMALMSLIAFACEWFLAAARQAQGLAIQRSCDSRNAFQGCQALSHDIAETTAASLSLPGSTSNANCVAFLSARDASGKFITDPNGNPIWQNYHVYFQLPGQTQLCLVKVPVAAPSIAAAPIGADSLTAALAQPSQPILNGLLNFGVTYLNSVVTVSLNLTQTDGADGSQTWSCTRQIKIQ